MSPTPSWPWMRRATSRRSRCTPSPTWAPICRPSRRAYRPTCTARCLPVKPAIYCAVDAVYQHHAGRCLSGAGRPEATYLLETIVETAARETGRDPAELRRKNFIPKNAFPYQTPVALQYDTGDYEASLDAALKLADYKNFAKRRAASEGEGQAARYRLLLLHRGLRHRAIRSGRLARLRRGLMGERQALQPHRHGAGAHRHPAHGQGHETTFAQLIAEKLGVPIDNVEVIHGDTDKTPIGMGTYGSRSIAVGGQAIVNACEKIIEKGKKIAAHLLEAAEGDIEFKDGGFTVKGTDRAKSIGEVVFEAPVPHHPAVRPDRAGMEETAFYDPPTSPIPRAPTSARSRSIPTPASSRSTASWRSTTSAR